MRSRGLASFSTSIGGILLVGGDREFSDRIDGGRFARVLELLVGEGRVQRIG